MNSDAKQRSGACPYFKRKDTDAPASLFPLTSPDIWSYKARIHGIWQIRFKKRRGKKKKVEGNITAMLQTYFLDQAIHGKKGLSQEHPGSTGVKQGKHATYTKILPLAPHNLWKSSPKYASITFPEEGNSEMSLETCSWYFQQQQKQTCCKMLRPPDLKVRNSGLKEMNVVKGLREGKFTIERNNIYLLWCAKRTQYIAFLERTVKGHLKQCARKTNWPWVRNKNILITFLKGTQSTSRSWVICLQFKITQIIHANHSLSVSRKNNTVRQQTAGNSRSTLGANSAHKSELTPWLSSWCSVHRRLIKDSSNFKHLKSHIRSAMLFCCFDQGFRLNSSLQQAVFLHN